MNFDWTSLLIGLIIGWLLEWIIDWLYWRRGRVDPGDIESGVAGLESTLAEVKTGLETCQTEYAELEAQYTRLQSDYDALQNRLDEERIRCIGRLTMIEGIDEEMAGRLCDAGISSGIDLGDLEREELRAATGLEEDEYESWWSRVSPGLAVVGAAVAIEQLSEEAEVKKPEAIVGVIELDEEEEGEIQGELIVEEELEAFDLDEDGEPDLVVETVTEGVDTDGDGQIDILIDQRVQADILDEAAVAAAEEAIEAEIEAELEPDDLTLIQGIGPKFAEKLVDGGVVTFAALAAASDDELNDIIQPQSWQKVDYDSWRAQARTFDEVPLREQVGDDLQLIEGIGPKYSELLRAADILTFAELADTEPERLAEIIAAPAWRGVDYDSWIAQAGLAAAGDVGGLEELQDELFSREEDNLALIQGIGDKSASALQQNGVNSYADLAGLTPEEVKVIILAAGLRQADFESWIEEAKLRAAGKRVPRRQRSYEDALVVSCPQDMELIEGVGVIYERRLYEAGVGSYWEVAQIPDEELSDILGVLPFQDVDLAEIRASAMALAVESGTVNRVWDGSNPDDFEPFEGIGVTYERRLYNAGYCTYEALAAATPEELEKICQPPAFNKPDFANWIDTAKVLAAAKGANEE